MKITVLIENTTSRPDLAAEHGLSLYIETENRTILFDAGQSGAFADNAEKLGIDLNKVDFCVLSHGHYDHGGGLKRFLEINDHAPVYVSRHAFEAHFSSGRDIGLDPQLADHSRIRPVGDAHGLDYGIVLHSCNEMERPHPFGVFGQTVQENGTARAEDYRHEQYLLIQEDDRIFCFSGCSHKGVLNILHWFQPDVFLGGFHFIKMDPNGRELLNASRQLAALPARYYTGHCTGQEQYAVLKQTLGPRLDYLSTGTVLEIYISLAINAMSARRGDPCGRPGTHRVPLPDRAIRM